MTNYGINPFIFYGGSYHQIAASRVAAAGVSYERGVGDDLDLQKGKLTFRCIDDDDTYRPTNPESALFGIIGAYLPFLYQIDSTHRFAGEIEQLTPGQTDDHQTVSKITSRGMRWVDFNVTGPLGTVGRWRDQVASPMFTQIKSLSTLRGYWPGEDGSDASVMSAGQSNVGYAPVSGVTFAAADGPSGSNKLLTLGSAGRVDGRFHSNISTSAWQISFTSNLNGADATERLCYAWTTSNGYSWVWSASTTTYNLTVTDETGTVLYNASVGNGGVAPGRNIVFRFKCTRSGSTWTAEYGWYPEDAPVLTGSSGTFTGSACRPVTWMTKTNTIMNGAYFGHVLATDGVSEDLQSANMLNAINGYPGESTCDRMTRLLTGRAIPFEILGDTAKAKKMGPQRPGTLKAQFQEIQRTEFGLIFESPDGRGLRLALHNYLITQANAPALTLTYPGHIGPGFAEVATTLELYNTVTAADASGIKVTAQEPNGRYGTADPPAGCGVVDKQVDVNFSSPNDVAQAANLWLRYFQQTERVGPITIDLDANPGLRTAVEAVDVGMFIRLSGKTPETLTLMVVRVGGRSQLTRHIVTFDTVPGDVFRTGTWNGSPQRHDLASCVTDASWTTTTNAVTFKMTDNEDWSTTAEPYDLIVAGERITVTNMNARTGSAPGPYFQSANITRSVNGVVKAQAAGTPVHIADGGVWGWG